jgi:hypothetical protein
MPVMMPPYALRYSLANGRVRSVAPGSHRLCTPAWVCASTVDRALFHLTAARDHLAAMLGADSEAVA